MTPSEPRARNTEQIEKAILVLSGEERVGLAHKLDEGIKEDIEATGRRDRPMGWSNKTAEGKPIPPNRH